ncbi:carboxylating nicotinate-nucleotide diphosphorylase [Collinsella intestinalis]|uniref:carboxylating nicotinate-nucleotide diphosphorylase n=1 Tax=Collinsella intestinalis TaxID=147207 RepID=UPI0022E7123F|nr:carboxylating nicotinate-nucleotide diphosphorylase [Collinsella intestinalis]
MNPITMNLVADDIIRFALREDMNAGDLSTESVCPERREAEVQLIAKAEGVIAGLDVFERAFTLLDPRTSFDARVADGDAVEPGQLLGIVRGDARVLLSGERVALNFLQRMSGIATYTRRMAAALEGTKTRLVDTRKTTPGLRIFEKAAVEAGGGANHRYNLSQAVMLKDNHIDAAGGIAAAVAGARAHAPFVCTVEVECEDLDMVREALEAGADIIMLDNMTHEQMAEAVALIGGRAKVEASGNVDAGNIRALADLGVDFISSGALTHSAPILDLSLKHLRMV